MLAFLGNLHKVLQSLQDKCIFKIKGVFYMFIFFGRNRNLLLRGHSLMTSTENDQKTQKFKYIYHLKTIEFAVT